jgi:hypothetical protein
MVTHSSTSRPVQCLCMAERTGCPVLTDLWSYVHFLLSGQIYGASKRALSHVKGVACHAEMLISLESIMYMLGNPGR